MIQVEMCQEEDKFKYEVRQDQLVGENGVVLPNLSKNDQEVTEE